MVTNNFIDLITNHSNDIKEFLTQDEVIILLLYKWLKNKCNKCFYSVTTKTRAV